jgi:glyoxylase-like metal-dependent hydrolase (beta-lactamase superfamily II)
LLALLPAGSVSRLTAQSVMQITTTSLRPGVWVLSGFANGNILVHDDGTDVLLVDAQSERRVGLADSSLRALTSRPVNTVVTTHYHDDHLGGNPHWKAQGARLVAQCNVAVQARKDTTITEWREWHRTPAAADALPTQCFQDSLTIARKGEQVVLRHVPSAHTDGDLIIWLPQANVLHMGDVLELGAPPFIDYWTGGTWVGMLAAVDAGLAIANDQTIIVPGHGPTTTRAGMVAYRAMLQDLGNKVRDAVQRGESMTAIMAAQPAARYTESFGSQSRADQFVQMLVVGFSRQAAVR